MGLSSSRDDGSNTAQTSYYDAADCLPQSKAPREKKKYLSWSGNSSDGDVEEKGEPVDDHAARLVPKTREITLGKIFAEGRKRGSRGADDGASNGDGSDGGGAESEGLVSQILRLALPALVSLCMAPFMSAVDTAYIGRLGSEHGGAEVGLGVQGLNTSVFNIIIFVFSFLATVLSPFVASARAKGDVIGAANLVGQLLTSALMMGIVLTICLEYSGPALLKIMGSSSENEAKALLFLRTRALSMPAVLFMSVANGAFRGFLDTRTPLFIALGANVLNFVLDPLLIFTMGLGIQGAAIATVAAEWTGAVAFLLLLGRQDPVIRPQWVSLPSSNEEWDHGKAIVTSSAAVFFRTLSLQVALSTASAFAARASSASIAAHQVASQLWLFLAFVADSLAVAAQSLIADRIGVNMILEAREVASLTLLLSAAWGFAILIAFQITGDALPLIFTSDKKVLAAVAPIIAVVGLMQPINTYVFAGDGILQGSKDSVYEAVTTVMSVLIGTGYVISCSYFKGDISLLDVWIGLGLMQGSRAITFSFRHWVDRRGPLALAQASDSEDSEEKEEESVKCDGEDLGEE